MSKHLVKQTFSTILAIATVVAILVFLNKYTDIFKSSPSPSPTVTIAPSEYPDYDIIKRLEREGSFVHLIVEAKDRGQRELENQVGSRTGWLNINGKFSRAYLYAEASINDRPISQFESVFVKLNYIGGHLFRPNSLKVPASENRTELLYALSDASYITQKDFYSSPVGYSDSKPFAKINWFGFLNLKSRISFTGFLASEIDGSIDMKLFYECAPETPDCKISIEYGKI